MSEEFTNEVFIIDGVEHVSWSNLERTLLNLCALDGILAFRDDVTIELLTTNQPQCFTHAMLTLKGHAERISELISVSSPSNGIAQVLRSFVSLTLSIADCLYQRELKYRAVSRQRNDCPAAIERLAPEGGLEVRSEAKNLSGMIVPKKEPVKNNRKTVIEPRSVKFDYAQSDMELAKKWIELARAKAPWIPHSEEKFAHCICSIRRKTQLTVDGMESVFNFIRSDPFWSDVATSPSGLLKRSSRNGLRKIDNILRGLKKRENDKNVVSRAEERLQYEPDDLCEWNPFDEL